MSLLGRFLNVDGSLLLFIPLAHVLARVIQVGAVKTRTVVGHTPDVKNLRRRPRRVQADVRPRRPPRVREGLQHRQGQGRGRRQGQDLRQGRPGGHRLVAGAGQGRPRPRAQGPAHAVRQAGLRQAARRARRPLPGRHLRRRPARRPARPLLPRHRRHRLRGLRPHRDHRRRLGEPRRRRCASAPSAGPLPGRRLPRSPTTARCSSAAAS